MTRGLGYHTCTGAMAVARVSRVWVAIVLVTGGSSGTVCVWVSTATRWIGVGMYTGVSILLVDARSDTM